MINNCPFAAGCNKKDCDKDFCLRKYKLDNLYRQSLLSQAQMRHVPLTVDEDMTDLNAFKRLSEIEAGIVGFVSLGRNLFIHSPICGNGKTSFSIRMIESYFGKIWPKCDLSCHALFINVPRFLLALKANIDKPNDYATYIMDHALEADLVVWDDIAAKTGTEYEINNLLSLIDSRIGMGKSNIYTSNLNAGEIKAALGKRLASRICGMSEDIELKGKDKRPMAGGIR